MRKELKLLSLVVGKLGMSTEILKIYAIQELKRTGKCTVEILLMN